MSNYRDDMNDTAVASDSLWVGLRSIAESTARASSVVLTCVALLLADAAVASDAVIDRTHSVLVDSALASDQVLGVTRLRTLMVDSARASEAVRDAYRLLLQDGALASDSVAAIVLARLSDAARAGDEVIGSRTSHALVQDGAKVSAAALVLLRDMVGDGVGASAAPSDRLRARTMALDAALAGDELLGAATQALLLADFARATGEAFGVLHARGVAVDTQTVAHDELLSPGMVVGQVWTAPTGEWAMSRWAPMGMTGLAVIDGTLYATSPAGVFSLDGQTEGIVAELRTGAIDMTGGALCYPRAAYLEYELSGPGAAASVAVTTTQAGAPTTYTYPLDARPVADALTNARAVFGRGLHGRHFAYTLRLTGQRAYINDWSVLVTTGKRSI